MGDIGIPVRHIEIEVPNPATAPVKEPSPAVPEKVPA